MSLRAVNENLVKENYAINMIDDIKSNKNTIVVLLGQLIYATNLDGSNKRIAEVEKHQNLTFCAQSQVYANAK